MSSTTLVSLLRAAVVQAAASRWRFVYLALTAGAVVILAPFHMDAVHCGQGPGATEFIYPPQLFYPAAALGNKLQRRLDRAAVSRAWFFNTSVITLLSVTGAVDLLLAGGVRLRPLGVSRAVPPCS